MGPTLHVDVAAPAERAWRELVEVGRWPAWGPTVSAAVLDDGAARLSAGATGAVRTPVGVWLPFRVEGWVEDRQADGDDDGARRSWSWRVAGVPATTHTVVALGPAACRIEMGVPWWAPAYLAVVGVALVRLRRLAEAG